jgi:hypothetical protein
VADRQSFAVYTSAGMTRFVLRRLPPARSVVHSRPMTNLLLWREVQPGGRAVQAPHFL